MDLANHNQTGNFRSGHCASPCAMPPTTLGALFTLMPLDDTTNLTALKRSHRLLVIAENHSVANVWL